MMNEPKQRERHNVNLSRQVWGELKLRSFQEGLSASDLVAYLVESFTSQGYQSFRLPRYQPRNGDEDRLGRTVFFPPDVWQKAQDWARRNDTSISSLIDYLMRRYLGLLPEGQAQPDPEPPRGGSSVRIGEERVYLGEDPIHIHYKTGKPSQESDS